MTLTYFFLSLFVCTFRSFKIFPFFAGFTKLIMNLIHLYDILTAYIIIPIITDRNTPYRRDSAQH